MRTTSSSSAGRVICNNEWLQQMRDYTVLVHPAVESDHCSIDIKVHDSMISGPKPCSGKNMSLSRRL
ncbi:hypothetical protein LIER_07548 [Lithospermum erythrorhizon]|uniref:Uncharacterized protein n=1 Tax=Lithospermum erythrorhizon TaxID=34254 RepID=A0AAV3P8Q2_LITER